MLGAGRNDHCKTVAYFVVVIVDYNFAVALFNPKKLIIIRMGFQSDFFAWL
jgi:hypothetical protein